MLEVFYFLIFLNIMLLSTLNRVLLMLLVFEFIMLKIFGFLILFSGFFEKSFCLTFLVILVLEASMGLSLLVSFIRMGSMENVVGFI